MRVASLLLLAALFGGMPMLLLNTLVMPQLESIQYTYSHLDEIAQKTVEQ